MIYDLLISGNVLKIMLFKTKLPIKVCLIFYVELTKTQNQNLRPLLDLFWCHKPIAGFKFAKRTRLKSSFVKISHVALFCVPFWFYTSRALFWKPSTLSYLFWWVEFNFELKSLFFFSNRWKFHFSDDFIPRVGIFDS